MEYECLSKYYFGPVEKPKSAEAMVDTAATVPTLLVSLIFVPVVASTNPGN